MLFALKLLQSAGRIAANAVDFFKLGQRLACTVHDAVQIIGQALCFRGIQPEIGVADACALANQVFVGGAGGHLFAHRAGDAHEVGHAAHQFGIAHFGEKTGAAWQRGSMVFTGERRLPQLHGVHAGGLVAIGEENQNAPVWKTRIPMGHDGRRQSFVDQVVGKEYIVAPARFVKNVKHFFAVWRANQSFETQLAAQVGGQIKTFVVARLQVHAARKNDAVVFGQLHAGHAYGIDAFNLLRSGVEHQVADGAFAVGLDAQQNQQAQACPGELGIHQGLVLVLHGLAVNPEAGFSVVFDLDGEVTAHGFNEHRVQHVDVGVFAAHMVLTCGHSPLKIVGGGQGDVALAAVVHITNAAIALDAPAEHPHIVQLLANLEGCQQFVLRDPQLDQ